MHRFAKAYEILELTPDASMEQVKKAYRRLALRYHPDLNSAADAHDRFLHVQKAYEIILTVDKTWNDEDLNVQRKTKMSARERDRKKMSREEALRRGRETARRFDAIRMQRDARQFARFKASIYYPWTMAMSYLSLVIFALILVDAFSANQLHAGYVVDKEPIEINALGLEITLGYSVKLANGDEVSMGVGPALQISKNTHISLAETMIFRDIPTIHVVNADFEAFEVNGFNKPPYLFFLLLIGVPIFILWADQPSAVFYSAGAYARYAVLIFILGFLIF